MPPRFFELQGHRGARGLRPENTFPSFEFALDSGASAVETDVHLSRDHIPVLVHDPVLSPRIYSLAVAGAVPEPSARTLVSALDRTQLRSYLAKHNPDSARFPMQEAAVGPASALFAREKECDPYMIPSLANLFEFAAAYAGALGQAAGKNPAQRERAARFRFDLELKRIPFHPEAIHDGFTGEGPGVLEEKVLEAVHAAGVSERTVIRSFDHRSLAAVRQLDCGITTGVLIAGTAPCNPADWVRSLQAQVYCPDYLFLDERQVRQLRGEGIRVIPWTPNQPADWLRLLDWGVDGLTTDFPDGLAGILREKGIAF